MTAPSYQADLERVVALLERWIARVAGDDGLGWLHGKKSEISEGAPEWKFFTAFSGAPRFVGKADLELQAEDLEEADALRRGWRPEGWSRDQAARAVLVLSYPHDDAVAYFEVLDRVFSTADAREQVALYQCLPLFPYPDHFRTRAAEGLRTNMTSVFNAVAHNNPYPAEYLDEAAWNQMVLKALFVGSALHKIQGLDERANPELARMLVDYAHERWSASRSVSPELWRPVGRFAGDGVIEDLARVLESENPFERDAAALALTDAGTPKANALLNDRPDLMQRIESGDLSWSNMYS